MFKAVLHLLFPVHCFVCRKSLTSQDRPYLCQEDALKCERLQGVLCSRCGLPLQFQDCPDCSQMDWAFSTASSLFLYQGELSKMIQAFKYEKKQFLIKTFQALMKEKLMKHKAVLKNEIIVPVPLCREKEKQRGFNQAALLGNVLAEILDVPFEKKVLFRKKEKQKAQASLSRQDRLMQIKGVFQAGMKKEKIAGKRVLLVDDVFTTGATAHECASILKSLEAAEVKVWTLARTPFHSSA